VRVFATIVTGMCGVALAAWGTVQLTPGDADAAEPAAVADTASPVVRCIRFVGDVDPAAVRGALHTKVGAPVDAGDVAADRALIEATLVLDGHLDASVTADGGIDVTFHVAAGPVYRLGAVRVIGDAARRYPALADELTIAAGGDVSVRAIERTQERLATWLTVHGVARALVTHALTIDRDAKRVDVTFDASMRPAALANRTSRR
jgi:hypothetical protein